MIFKVSEKFKGSCVLPTLKKAIWAGMTISITGNKLRASDVKDVVRKGILIPVDKDYDHDAIEKDHDVIIINNTDRVLVLGKTALRPNGSLPISKDEAEIPEIISAEEDGIITIISDEETYVEKKTAKKKTTKKKAEKKKTTKKDKKKDVKVIEASDFVTPESGEDKNPVAVTWNPQTQTTEEAIKIPKSEDFIKVGEDEREDMDFIDGEDEIEEEIEVKAKKVAKKKKTTKKKTIKKKVAKKKTVAKKTKKKVSKAKKKKVTTLKPVGEKRLPKTEMDAMLELDSRGNPLTEKPGDILKHMIDDINYGEDVSFADDEQALDRYRKRTDME